MKMISHEPVVGIDRYRDRPVAIVGAGPSFCSDVVGRLMALGDRVIVFALNHTITELYQHPNVWWVCNDMDRTFESQHISSGMRPRIKYWEPWRCVTQRLFIPGEFGDIGWYDKHGKRQPPLKFRLPCPEGSHVAWYIGGEGRSEKEFGYVRNGHSVLELALEVATLWKMSPIMLFGCDMDMDSPETYYAPEFRWKDTPPKVVRGKLRTARESLVANRGRWPGNVIQTSPYWKGTDFSYVSKERAFALLRVCTSLCESHVPVI